MATQMQKHLRKYIEDGIQQKVRLGNLKKDYLEQETKSRERAIDQRQLLEKYQAEGRPQDRIQDVKVRKEMDEKALLFIQKIIEETSKDIEGTTNRMVSHLEELTSIEFNTGGFITHGIGVDEGASLAKDTMTITFKPGGRVEIPIAPRIGNWKDSSQLTIKKNKKVGA